MAQDLKSLSHKLLDIALKNGAEAADVLAVESDSVSVEVLSGALEHAERSEGIDVGLRVLIGQKQACVSASDTRDETLNEMVTRAVTMARFAPDDPYCGLADESQLARNFDSSDLELADDAPKPESAEMQDWAQAADTAALSVDGVTQTQGSGAGWSETRIHLAASNGLSAGYRRTGVSVSSVAIAGEGPSMERDYAGESRTYFADLPDASEIGQLAGKRAVERAGGVKPPTGSYPVLYDERVSASLIGHLLSAINGQSVARGASWLKDAMGSDVLPKGMSLTEDPHRKRISGSKLFDAEGLATQKRLIVEDGVLQSWTLDLSTARTLGLQSTANASKGVSSPPSPSAGNMMLTQGDKSQAELIKDMGTGLLVTYMIGATINPTTGDYSRGAAGYWVENGVISHVVNGCTIAGNLRDMFKTMIAADDARMHLSRVVPSLLVEGLTIAGE